MNFFSFAFRNVGRNRSRTLITVGAMAFAGALMIIYASLMEGMVDTFERNAVGMSAGDIQIHAKGYRDDPDLYKRIENSEKIIANLEKAGFKASSRLYGFGLAAAGAESSGVKLRGVDIDREPGVTQLNRHIKAGSWLTKGDDKGVVIGGKLSKTLGVTVGDEIIIVSQAADGSMANDLYKVRGILKSVGESIDRSGFFMTEAAFREVMVVDSGSHEIAVARPGDMDLKIATQSVTAIAPGLETKTWRELQPVVAKMIDTSSAGLFIMLLITYTAIGMVVLNAMLMSVFERIREFGVMKAIGVTPWQIMIVIFIEAMTQAVLACALAAVVGVSLSFYLESHGIDLSSIAGADGLAAIGGVAFDPIWTSKVTISSVFTPLGVLIVIIALAVIYPGVKAAVIRPVKAIHHL